MQPGRTPAIEAQEAEARAARQPWRLAVLFLLPAAAGVLREVTLLHGRGDSVFFVPGVVALGWSAAIALYLKLRWGRPLSRPFPFLHEANAVLALLSAAAATALETGVHYFLRVHP